MADAQGPVAVDRLDVSEREVLYDFLHQCAGLRIGEQLVLAATAMSSAAVHDLEDCRTSYPSVTGCIEWLG